MPDQSGQDPAGGWRHPGWSWTIRHPQVIPVGYGAFALFAGGALGIMPGLVTGDWKSGQTRDQLWIAIILAALAVAALVVAQTARRGRDRMLERNGTAYIVAEQARDWTHDDASRFREGIRRQFARIVQVPGPGEVGRTWDWPLDEGARDWDEKVTELVRAFRVLSIDESRDGRTVTPDGVFVWAWWAVAAAFGMRAVAADRSLELDVWQRPSKARAGTVEPATWGQRPHRFTGSESLSGGLRTSEFTWPVDLTLSRVGRGVRGSGSLADVTILLVRYSSHPWGSPDALPGGGAAPGEEPLSLHLHDTAGVSGTGTSRAEVHELRCVPVSGETFVWADFPALAAEAAAWVQRKSKELGDRTFLLAAAMPNEIALGLGILAGQESRRATWPAGLWPVVFQPGTRDLVIPNLDLGTVRLDTLGTDRRQR